MAENKPKKAWDAPREGWVRYTIYVNEDLLKKFKETAWNEKKSIVEAIDEASQNWVYTTDDEVH